jgi:hypothetical protein
MIDWGNLAVNALWILGCSLALAAFSYASWQGSVRGEKISVSLRSPGIRLSLHLGGVLFCLGLAFGAGTLLEKIIWALLGIAILVHQKFG